MIRQPDYGWIILGDTAIKAFHQLKPWSARLTLQGRH